jgi:hypothetical protein
VLGLALLVTAERGVAGTDGAGPRIDVRALGARGDGTSDDTEAIRAAFGAIPPTGGTVYFPPGTYLIDQRGRPDGTAARSMAVLQSRTVVLGEPGRSWLKQADRTWRPHAWLLRNAAARNGNTDLTISGLGFDGNDRGNHSRTGPDTALFRCQRCSRLVVEDTAFRDAKGKALELVGGDAIEVRGNRFFHIGQISLAGDAVQANGVRGIRITGNLIENSDEGIFCQNSAVLGLQARDCLIADNTIVRLPAAAKCVASGVPFACCAGERAARSTVCDTRSSAGCLCNGGRTTGASIGVLAEGASVIGNYLERASGITVQGLVDNGPFDTRDVRIERNVVDDPAANPALEGSGAISVVASTQAVSGVEIRGNTVRSARDAGVRVYAGPSRASEIAVVDNTVELPCLTLAACGGIAIEGPSGGVANVTLAANRITASRRYGILVDGPTEAVRLLANDLHGNARGDLGPRPPGTPWK